ncbi:hypothetical protein BDW68DRAFT_83331 [Aspergillus falconensis]
MRSRSDGIKIDKATSVASLVKPGGVGCLGGRCGNWSQRCCCCELKPETAAGNNVPSRASTGRMTTIEMDQKAREPAQKNCALELGWTLSTGARLESLHSSKVTAAVGFLLAPVAAHASVTAFSAGGLEMLVRGRFISLGFNNRREVLQTSNARTWYYVLSTSMVKFMRNPASTNHRPS